MRDALTATIARMLIALATTACGAASAQLPPQTGAAASERPAPRSTGHSQGHYALLDRYCLECHNAEDWAGGVAFDTLTLDSVAADAPVWEKTVRKIRTGMMPPAGKPRPPRAVLDAFAESLETQLDAAAVTHPNPGSKSLHRLNRTEYANAIRDLLAYEVDVSTLLPEDDAAQGFDNIADVLSVSPTLIQAYVAAAMKISRGAVGDPAMAPVTVTYEVPRDLSQDRHIDGLPLGTRGGILFTHNFPLDAEYEFRISAGSGFRFSGPAGGPPPAIDITLNGAPVSVPDPRKFRLRVPAGPQTITVALVDRRRWQGVDDLYARAMPRRDDIESVVITGPFDATGPGDTPSRRAIFVCRPESESDEAPCARRILSRLATKAFRRPLGENDPAVETLMRFYEAGRRSGDFETGIQHGIARLLADPRFLYRIEEEPADLAPGAIYRISDLELASRLSFFLWSSIPDDELLEVASRGALGDARELERQVRRMLADPRASALVENFAGQWLQLRQLRDAQPDDREFDENLRRAFERETELLLETIMREDRSVLELLDADYTFLNERLARHYGITGVRGDYMRRVQLPEDSPRRGLLGHGSILTVTSVGDRTSPVIRGAWIVENLLGAPVPQPPPGVETNLEPDTAARPTSLRERLEIHRANPNCASCHEIMDPIGFTLENFDLVGRWRERDGEVPIDASGTLVDGTRLDGPHDLRRALLDRSESFVTGLIERLLTYALGRHLEHYDQPAVRTILREARANDYRFSSIVLGIARSVPFQMRTKSSPRDSQAPAHRELQASLSETRSRQANE